MSGWSIRKERASDRQAIHDLAALAFADHPHSAGAEPLIIDRLRADADLSLSHVAITADDVVIGHAAWSAARLYSGEQGWFTLGPISVHPGKQGQGIGRALVEAGHDELRARGAKGTVVLGDPALYERFGYRRGTGLHIEGELAQYFQARPFTGDVPEATVTFAPAFSLIQLREDGGD
jgi:putative acetyltransferase